MEKQRELTESLLAAAIIVSSVLAAALLSIPLFLGFAVGLAFMVLMALRNGILLNEIATLSLSGLKKIKPVIQILLLIGCLIPVWISSGTIPALISLGIEWVHTEWIVPLSFLLSALISFLLGTSIGTLGSLGLVVIGISMTAGVPIPLVAGALVSGAFFGDRFSPLSSMFHLVAHSVEVQPRVLFRQMLWTTGITVGISLLIYSWLNAGWVGLPDQRMKSDHLMMGHYFDISNLSFLPLFVLFGCISFRVNTIRSLSFSVMVGIPIALFDQGLPPLELFLSLWFGYQAKFAELSKVLKGGGTLPMLPLIIFIMLAGIMNALLERTQILRPLVEAMFKKALSLGGYTFRTVILSILLAMVGSNQAFPIILTGSSLTSTWQRGGMDRSHLGRVIADSALVSSGLIPWNMVAILSSAAIGIPVLTYAPYAVLLWIFPIVTIIFSCFQSNVQIKTIKLDSGSSMSSTSSSEGSHQ